MTLDTLTKELNALAKELDTVGASLIDELDRQRRDTILTNVRKHMLHKGATQRSTNLALQGLHELLKPIRIRDPHALPPPEASSTSESHQKTLGRWLSEIAPQELNWLWPQRIPQNKLTVLEGEPGIGTSLLAITIAASVSSGTPLPAGTSLTTDKLINQPSVGADSSCPPPIYRPTPNNVILIAPHDTASDTLIPRLQAAGGDPTHILLLDTFERRDPKTNTLYNSPVSLPEDLELLENTIQRLNAALVIIDPMATILRSATGPRLQDTLALLAQLAERTNCTILLIRHLKPSNRPPHLHTLNTHAALHPSNTIARSTLLLLQHPHEPNQRLLITTKHPLTTKPNIVTFQIIANGHNVPSLQYLGESQPTIDQNLTTPNLSAQRQSILHVLQNSPEPLNPTQIAQRTDLTYDAVRLLLSRMHEDQTIARPSRGHYTINNHQDTIDTLAATEFNPPTLPSNPSNKETIAPITQPPLLTPSVGADLSCPSPIYRPSLDSIAPNPHQSKESTSSARRGEGGREGLGGPLWSPALGESYPDTTDTNPQPEERGVQRAKSSDGGSEVSPENSSL